MRHLLSAADLSLAETTSLFNVADEMHSIHHGRSRSCRPCAAGP